MSSQNNQNGKTEFKILGVNTVFVTYDPAKRRFDADVSVNTGWLHVHAKDTDKLRDVLSPYAEISEKMEDKMKASVRAHALAENRNVIQYMPFSEDPDCGRVKIEYDPIQDKFHVTHAMDNGFGGKRIFRGTPRGGATSVENLIEILPSMFSYDIIRNLRLDQEAATALRVASLVQSPPPKPGPYLLPGAQNGTRVRVHYDADKDGMFWSLVDENDLVELASDGHVAIQTTEGLVRDLHEDAIVTVLKESTIREDISKYRRQNDIPTRYSFLKDPQFTKDDHVARILFVTVRPDTGKLQVTVAPIAMSLRAFEEFATIEDVQKDLGKTFYMSPEIVMSIKSDQEFFRERLGLESGHEAKNVEGHKQDTTFERTR